MLQVGTTLAQQRWEVERRALDLVPAVGERSEQRSVQQVEDTRDPLQAMGVRKPNQLVLHSVAAQWQVAVAQLQSKVAAQ